MRRIVLAVLFFLAAIIAAEAKPNKKVTIKVGSYNLMTSDSRVKHMAKTADMSPQRYWCHSAKAVAAQVSDLDCDIIGLQEVCDSIWGLTGEKGFRKMMEDAGNTKYKWILYPNGSKGNLSYDVAIGYKSDVFTELESGIYWLAGIFSLSGMIGTVMPASRIL